MEVMYHASTSDALTLGWRGFTSLCPLGRSTVVGRTAIVMTFRWADVGRPLSPAGDPRAVLLLRLAEASGNEAPWRRIRNLWRAGAELRHDLPNLDFGLAAVTRTYGLPDQAPLLLFALGRTIGWMAHAIEEYASSQLIRPRARYTGPVP